MGRVKHQAAKIDSIEKLRNMSIEALRDRVSPATIAKLQSAEEKFNLNATEKYNVLYRLARMYRNDGMSPNRIASLAGISSSLLTDIFRMVGVPLRSPQEAMKLVHTQREGWWNHIYRNYHK